MSQAKTHHPGSIGPSRLQLPRRRWAAAIVVPLVLAGGGSAFADRPMAAIRPDGAPPGECLTGVWTYSAYSSALNGLQLAVTGVQIELGPGYFAVSSLDGSATGTLDPAAPAATYAVALNGVGAMSALEDGTIRWYADQVMGGLTGIPGGASGGAQALLPELPMTVSCDATAAELTTAGGTTITLTRSDAAPQPPAELPSIPQRPASLDCLEGTWVLDTWIDSSTTTSLEYARGTIDFRDGVWTQRPASAVDGEYQGQDVTADLSGQAYGFYDTVGGGAAIGAAIRAAISVSDVERSGGAAADDPALLAALAPTFGPASFTIACAGDNLVLSASAAPGATDTSSTEPAPTEATTPVTEGGVAVVLHRPGTEPSDTTITTAAPTTTAASTTAAPASTAAPATTAPTTTVAAATTVAPPTATAPPTSAAPATTVAAPPPTGAQPPPSSVPIAASFSFPWTFWHVPQMGTEPVEGTGCGGQGDLPDTIPDGLWYGQVISANADGLAFDVRCLFFGNLATQLYQEYTAEHPDEASPPYIDGTWTVNNSTRTRNVPVSANFAIYPAEAVPAEQLPDGGVLTECRVPDGAAATADDPTLFSDAWLAIVDGQAVWMVGSCPHD